LDNPAAIAGIYIVQLSHTDCGCIAFSIPHHGMNVLIGDAKIVAAFVGAEITVPPYDMRDNYQIRPSGTYLG
jgi:hypothetical protein